MEKNNGLIEKNARLTLKENKKGLVNYYLDVDLGNGDVFSCCVNLKFLNRKQHYLLKKRVGLSK